MRIVKSMMVAGAIVAVMPSMAQAQWYVSGEAGVGFNSKAKVTGNNTNYDTEYSNPGYAGVVAVGRNYDAVKGELELGYRSNDVSRIGGTSAGGSVGLFTAFVNGLYDFNPDGVWHPLLGAGIGLGNVNTHSLRANGTSSYSISENRFAYQGIAALAYDICPNWQARVDYRYVATTDPSGSINGTSVTGAYADHTVLVGFTYKFNPPAKPAQAPVPVAAPAPVPPPPAPIVAPAPLKNFIVFFDFDQAAINAQAQAIIEQAAATAKKGNVVRVQLTGHTDLAGGPDYNQKLSVRRAEAVKSALVKLGVDAKEISLAGKGKSEPLVPTKDGVPQPQNRRVEILLQ